MARNTTTAFTLIETLFAIFILTVGIVAVISAFPLGIRLTQAAQVDTIATQLAQDKIEEVISQSYSETAVGTVEAKHALASPFSQYSRETVVTYYDPTTHSTTNTDLGMKQVRVTVSWKLYFEASEKKIDVYTLIAER